MVLFCNSHWKALLLLPSGVRKKAKKEKREGPMKLVLAVSTRMCVVWVWTPFKGATKFLWWELGVIKPYKRTSLFPAFFSPLSRFPFFFFCSGHDWRGMLLAKESEVNNHEWKSAYFHAKELVAKGNTKVRTYNYRGHCLRCNGSVEDLFSC